MTNIEKEIADRFKRDTADHVLTVLHDDGLYRHLRCTKPGTSFYWFEIITWPGSLVFRGDMDGAPVFSRIDDMFAFFRSAKGRINPHYWSEKLSDSGRSVQVYSEDVLREHIEDRLKEYEEDIYADLVAEYKEAKAAYDAMTSEAQRFARKPIEPESPRQIIEDYDADGMLSHPDGARELLRELEKAGVVSDTWEWDLTDWDWSFLWACHAIVWAIAQYDATKAQAEPTEYLVWSNHYRAWWGPGKAGYFGDITKAGRYTHADALDCAGARSWTSDTQPPEVVIPAPPAHLLASAAGLDKYLDEQITAASATAVLARAAKKVTQTSSTPIAVETVNIPGVTR